DLVSEPRFTPTRTVDVRIDRVSVRMPLVPRAASWKADHHPHLSQILDLFAEDSWRGVYAGELEVRPPGAPTTLGRTRTAQALATTLRLLIPGHSLPTRSLSAGRMPIVGSVIGDSDSAGTRAAVAPSHHAARAGFLCFHRYPRPQLFGLKDEP